MPDTTPTITSRSGVLLVVCAPSGTGKTTLIQRLRDEFPNFAYSISCTTRAPRGHETDGKDYHFLSVEEFLRRREAGFFAEWANVHGNYYGTPLAPVLETLKAGQDVLFDIDVQGAAQLHLSLPRGQYVFLLPPSLSELERRLRGRGTDDEASIARRLSKDTKISMTTMAISLAMGLHATHMFVPPTPGPLAVAGILNADLGMVILFGALVSIPVMLVGYFASLTAGKKYYYIPEDDKIGRAHV